MKRLILALFLMAAAAADSTKSPPSIFLQDPKDSLCLSREDFQRCDEEDLTLLVEATDELSKLQNQQEEVWLNPDTQVPLLHFGTTVSAILDKASAAVRNASPKARALVLERFVVELKELYQNQLQSLREHYGCKYEAALDDVENTREGALAEAAQLFTKGFREAAQHAIPQQCRQGKELEDADFSYVSALQGLVSDMMEATSMRGDLEEEEDEEGENEQEGKKPAKWYEKLAARALVLGVNYLQGWLAWQGVKRAAAQRDKDMPKFPLF
jgi:vacuolar-type H+-ATPase subunit H